MGWRERFGAGDERAQIAARARALLDAAGARPSPGGPPAGGAAVQGAAAAPLPPSRGGWVPSGSELGAIGLGAAPTTPGGPRHAVDRDDPFQPGDWPPPLLPLVAAPEGDHDRPGGLARWRDTVRFAPGRRGLVAVAAVVVVIGSVAGGVLFRGGQSSAVTLAAASGAPAPSAASVLPVGSGAAGTTSPPATSSVATSSGATGSTSPGATVTVDVAGLVLRPGVYTLPAGSRVDDALREAGGARPGADLSTLNRARLLVDGEQLAVGVPGAVPAPSAPGAGGSAAAGGAGGSGAVVDLNTAGLADLDTLPGVGPVLAQAILDWRTDHGRFSSVDDLQQVSGIGPSRFATLKDLVTV